jgi:hypothetical protein
MLSHSSSRILDAFPLNSDRRLYFNEMTHFQHCTINQRAREVRH